MENFENGLKMPPGTPEEWGDILQRFAESGALSEPALPWYQTADAFAIASLVAAVLFILGLKGLASPSTARRGNFFAMLGMVIAVGSTLLQPGVTDYAWVLGAMAIGALIGVPIALKIKMTAMPQLVALLHSFVGLAAVVVALGTYFSGTGSDALDATAMTELFMGTWIGAITFTGSVIAFGKLQGVVRSAPLTFRGQHMLNLLMFISIFSLGWQFVATDNIGALLTLTAVAGLLGITLILPIGGADMPVIVSMLNSYSGWAAAATGFTLNNYVLIITGALVGSSGAILSYVMCKAMNRRFISVLLGGFGEKAEESADTAAKRSAAEKGVKEAAVEDAAYVMTNARKVVIVPGYGMAVSQAQHALKDVMETLEGAGVEVKFAVHPVAGRMPGHMNVLLAEADVPYTHVQEMEDINPAFAQTDVVLVVGANDVVNPDAKTEPSSPLYGMPVLEVYKAKTVYVVKRSMRAGYAGVENSLFYRDNTYLIFGDARDVCEKLASAVKAAG